MYGSPGAGGVMMGEVGPVKASAGGAGSHSVAVGLRRAAAACRCLPSLPWGLSPCRIVTLTPSLAGSGVTDGAGSTGYRVHCSEPAFRLAFQIFSSDRRCRTAGFHSISFIEAHLPLGRHPIPRSDWSVWGSHEKMRRTGAGDPMRPMLRVSLVTLARALPLPASAGPYEDRFAAFDEGLRLAGLPE